MSRCRHKLNIRTMIIPISCFSDCYIPEIYCEKCEYTKLTSSKTEEFKQVMESRTMLFKIKINDVVYEIEARSADTAKKLAKAQFKKEFKRVDIKSVEVE